MDTMWEKIKKGLKDGAALSMEKIEEYTKVGKLKIEEFSAKRKIERNFVDIGERVFELVNDGKSADVQKDILVGNAIQNIKDLQKELVTLEQKIRDVQEEAKKKGKDRADDDEVTGI